MVTNPYTRYFDHSGEQSLLDDLVIESIQIHGIDVSYIPRTDVDKDPVTFEDPRVAFDTVFDIEVYLKSYDAFEGDGSFFSNLGVEIRNQVTFTMSSRRFMDEIGTPMNFPRPREGDLIHYPFNNKLFEIKYVEKHIVHYPLGALQMYDIKCELLEYAGQTFDTGIDDIDKIFTMTNQDILAGNVVPLPLDDTVHVQSRGEEVTDFTEVDPYSEREDF